MVTLWIRTTESVAGSIPGEEELFLSELGIVAYLVSRRIWVKMILAIIQVQKSSNSWEIVKMTTRHYNTDCWLYTTIFLLDGRVSIFWHGDVRQQWSVNLGHQWDFVLRLLLWLLLILLLLLLQFSRNSNQSQILQKLSDGRHHDGIKWLALCPIKFI